mgnify:CR=1 FL=1
MLEEFDFHIDVVSTCNLKCPSCPVGNFGVKPQSHIMQPDLLEAILVKATKEAQINTVSLFNWTEPLIHPKITKLIKVVNSFGLKCNISTNLSLKKNVDWSELLKSDPHQIRISVSGFSDLTYSKTHRKGNIVRVKENMKQLAKDREATDCATNICVVYIRHLGNLDDEILMKKYSENLGFSFAPCWAFMMPLEKALTYVSETDPLANITKEDEDTIQNLALPLLDAFKISSKYKSRACRLQSHQMALTANGEVSICCALYDNKYLLGSYLSKSLNEIQDEKMSSDICDRCLAAGGHVYVAYGAEEFDRLAAQNIVNYYSKHAVNLNVSNEGAWRKGLVMAKKSFNMVRMRLGLRTRT